MPEETKMHPMFEMATVLSQDYLRCCQELLKEGVDIQFWRRATIRSFFAYVEGACSVFRHLATGTICLGKSKGVPLTALALLQDEQFSVERNGKCRPEKTKISTLNYIAFTIRVVSELSDAGDSYVTKVFSEDGWRKLQDVCKVRDRLMHPKSLEHLTVTDDEYDLLNEAGSWFAIKVAVMMRFLPKEGDLRFTIEEDELGLHCIPVEASPADDTEQ